ncbi:MAG: hypothetical protein ACOC2N_00965 [Spirochaetota bacterium]
MKEERVPDILIEQYVLGELPAEEARRIEKTDGFVERVAAIERDNADFSGKYPAGAFALRVENQYRAEIESESRPTGRTRRTAFRFMTLAVPGAAILVIGLLIFGGLGIDVDPIFDPSSEVTRLKGIEPELSVYRSIGGDNGSAEELSDGDRAAEGDRLQIAYNAAGQAYGVIVSIDGRGALTLHHPVTVSSPPVLVAGGEQSLPYGYELDDAPEFEKFYFITSEDAFDVSEILGSVRNQVDDIVDAPDTAMRVPVGFAVESITIRKGE